MTWRELFARRPKWWVALVTRFRTTLDAEAEPDAVDALHHRTSAERARFWEEFRAGQHEADLRVLEGRKTLVPCRQTGDPK